MKLRYKKQAYQTDAVNAVIDVFEGQEKSSREQYKLGFTGHSIDITNEVFDLETGFANPPLSISDLDILKNINSIQAINNIEESTELIKQNDRVSLDIEMETGTGKTYVYIKTIFELNLKYGFSKFIIVVPSIPIREGVKKSFESTEEHFMDLYGKKARYFIYNSKHLDEIEHFSSSDSIQVMIINIQAFNTRGADGRKIYEELDEFQSRRPIDVISKNRPILILDEPQKMGGKATQDALKEFTPLFILNYSATHKTKHNTVYVLDALDAYNKKLVKKIEVKGFVLKNLRGTNGYVYLDSIILSPNKPPKAKIEFEINYKTKSINKETRQLFEGANLYIESNELEQYKNGFVLNEINPSKDSITFLNGITLKIGEAYGDLSDDDMRRIQIRETIKSHIEKESQLYDRGIKVLSLFFIDEVAKYRKYDELGNEINSLYGDIFEHEYKLAVKDYLENHNTPYCEYLKSIDACETHKGYFSIDKKGRKIDSEIKRGTDISDDESAYDLILKDKETLLSLDEKTRFIFSHSALREGWDNPNVFQICTLRHTQSEVQKHQEVGRGLRLCVNQDGERMDLAVLENAVHSVNKLTVIANDSYESFVSGLQSEIGETLYSRPMFANPEFFEGKKVKLADGSIVKITKQQAAVIYKYLIKNDYLDDSDRPNDNFKIALANDNLAKFPQGFEHLQDGVVKYINSIYDPSIIKNMFSNGNSSKVIENELNKNFNKIEFQTLWKLINHKYSYYVDFDSNELIEHSVKSIDKNLMVSNLMYTVTTSEQKSEISSDEIKSKDSFKVATTKTENLKIGNYEDITYDLLGKIASLTNLTRKTVAKILTMISKDKFEMFRLNPEEFIRKVSQLINDEKASLIIDHITYNQIEGAFDSNIFAESKTSEDFAKAMKSTKHIRDYVFTDGIAEESTERKFAEQLEAAEEVVVYAKLPKAFYIPTPVGKYSPDWAIAFKEDGINHIYFIAETKGSMESLQLRKVEEVKIECAKKLFKKMSSSNVYYDKIDSYDQLISVLNSLKPNV